MTNIREITFNTCANWIEGTHLSSGTAVRKDTVTPANETKPPIASFAQTISDDNSLPEHLDAAVASFLRKGIDDEETEIPQPQQPLKIEPPAKSISELLIEYTHNTKGWPGLHYAIDQKRPDVAKAFILYYPEQVRALTPRVSFRYQSMSLNDDNWYTSYDPGFSALELAIKEGFSDVVELLLQKGADPNLQRRDTVADFLSKSWNYATGKWEENVKHLMWDDKSASYHIYTPLYWALSTHHEQITKLLLDHGATLRSAHYFKKIDQVKYKWITEEVDTSPLRLALEWKNDVIVEKILQLQMKEAGLSQKTVDASIIEIFSKYEVNDKHWPAVHNAIFHDDLDALEKLLRYGAPFREKGICPQSAFQLALEKQDFAFGQLLLDNGFNRSQAFDQAVGARKAEWIKRLAVDGNKTGPALKVAVEMHDIDLVKFLLEQGFKDSQAIHVAFEQNQYEIASILIANENLSNPNVVALLNTCSTSAIKKGDLEFFKLFYSPDRLPAALAIFSSINEGQASILEYLSQRYKLDPQIATQPGNVTTSSCYTRAVELNRLDLLKILIHHHGISDAILQDCIKRAIDGKKQEILDYLFSL